MPSPKDLQVFSKTLSASGIYGRLGRDEMEGEGETCAGTVGILSLRFRDGTNRNEFGDGDSSTSRPLFAGTLESAR